MTVWFHTNAARDLVRRRKGPFVRMILVAFIGSLWCVIGASWTLATWREISNDASAVYIDVLLNDELSEGGARQLNRQVSGIHNVSLSRLIREQEVWSEFTKDIDVDDELRDVVTLPRIVRFSLEPSAVSIQRISSIEAALKRHYDHAIAQIVWSKPYVKSIEARRRDLVLLGSAAGVLSLIMFLYALIYAFRAELNAIGGDLRAGSLLGARASWIAAPHFLVSLFAGMIGIAIAGGLVVGVTPEAVRQLPWLANIQVDEVLIMIGVIVVMGVLVSWIQSIMAAHAALKRNIRT